MKNIFLVIFLFALNYGMSNTIQVDSLTNSGVGSLRAAVNTSINGDTIRFNPLLISNGSVVIYLDSNIVINKSLVIKGLYTPSDTLYLSGNNLHRIFDVDSVSSMVLDSMVCIEGDQTGNNSGHGGALRILNSSRLTIINSVFRNNKAVKGGGIFCESKQLELTIENSFFYFNQSINNYGKGGAICLLVDSLSLIIENSNFLSNRVIGDRGSGGAIFLERIFSNYTAGTKGFLMVELRNVDFFKNECNYQGGAVFLGTKSKFHDHYVDIKITGCKWVENKALGLNSFLGQGGGMYVYGNSFTEFSNVGFSIRNSLFENNYAFLRGGGVYLGSSGAKITQPKSNLEVKLINSRFEGNYANTGAGFYSYSVTTKLNVENCKMLNNSCGFQGGGSVFTIICGSDTNVGSLIDARINKSLFKDNSAYDHGGCINLKRTLGMVDSPFDSIKLEVDSSNFYNNTGGSGSVIYAHSGGNVIPSRSYSSSSIVKVGNSTIANNYSSAGIISSAAHTYFDSSQISNAKVILDQMTLVDNETYYGGALKVATSSLSGTDSANVHIVNSTLARNISDPSQRRIGGIWLTGSNSIAHLKGSILALNDSVNISNPNLPKLNSGGYNIFSDSALMDTVSTDLVNIDSTQLNLGPLTTNGGISKTVIPLSPSIAINSGDPIDNSDAQNIPIVGVREIGAAEFCQRTFDTDTVVSCASYYMWLDDVVYTENNNSATFVTKNAAGCDSVITLNLTLNNVATIDTVHGCDSIVWLDGNTYFPSEELVSDTLTNSLGCDSVVFLHFIPSNYGVDRITICDSLTWINGITYYSNDSTATDTLVSSFGCDSVVTLNLNIVESSFDTVFMSACDSFTWQNGITYYNSVRFVNDTLVNIDGCDSIVSLDLLIYPTQVVIDSVLICDQASYTWRNGFTYYQDTSMVFDTLLSVTGCDSIVMLNLTFSYGSSSIDTVFACQFYTWINGQTYLNSIDSVSHILENSQGCDSTVWLDLTIGNFSNGTDSITVCDSLTWINGITYYSSTTTIYTIPGGNSMGCDSIITLYLTVNNNQLHDVVSACDSYTWINGVTYTNSVYSVKDTLVNQYGCDSIVTLDLTLNHTINYIDNVVSCGPYTWIDGITYYSSNNSEFQVFTSAGGCDSIVFLNLEINEATTSVDSVITCDDYTWIDGITYSSSVTGPSYLTQNGNGCDSTITLNLIINRVDTTVRRGNFKLTALAGNATFKWIDCEAMQYILNESDSILVITENGRFAAEITQNGCVDTSKCFEFIDVGMTYFENMNVQIYPNPSSELVFVNKGDFSYVEISVSSISGLELDQFVSKEQISKVSLRSYPSGVYLFFIRNEGFSTTYRIIKQ